MTRRRLPIVPVVVGALALALVALLAYGVLSKGDDTSLDEAVAKGDRPEAPARTLPVLGSNGERSLADLKGKVVVLNFWASWCTPCKAEAPVLERAQHRLQSSGAGTVLGVTYRDATPNSLNFVRKNRVTYPSIRDVDGDLAQDYGTRALPETFVIDRQGRIAAISRGQITQQSMDRALKRVLG